MGWRFGGCRFGGFVDVSRFRGVKGIEKGEVKTLSQLIDWWKERAASMSMPRQLGDGFVSYLVKPTNPQFEGFDFFVFVERDGRLSHSWGYQVKEATTEPSDEATATIKKALKGVANLSDSTHGIEIAVVWLQGDSSSSPKGQEREDKIGSIEGWPFYHPSPRTVQLFLGTSLAETCPFKLLDASSSCLTREESVERVSD
ncbi:unnamed protein product [Vitrella brassicaformis CCMP3155]|uniref:Uncharacterized protein n=1 Tax=Vitrella brassicaformis (strain CCMP3155) TaxID=1169540 RepID=A0A0G4EAP3_VITBC|nr:unnamed protein product [Vitrella brassicaformis CCMP3155]|eukprot:CEL92506.1 unnamed protein product [Vitrella brassicaformis CCMP3155]